MGYWSIMATVDDLQDAQFVTSLEAAEAVSRLEETLPIPNRVVCERSDDGLVVTTVKHTPAWAFAGLVPLLIVRRDRVATVEVAGNAGGTQVRVNGRLDHRAATKLRALPT